MPLGFTLAVSTVIVIPSSKHLLLRWIFWWLNGLGAAVLPALGQLLIPAVSDWPFLKGVAEPPVGWRDVGFSAADWNVGGQPLFAGVLRPGTELIGFGSDFHTVYLRHTFTVEEPRVVGELLLNAFVDDGFVAWLNGHEIVRHNVPDEPLSRFSEASGPAPEPLSEETFQIVRPSEVLVTGENVLAIQVLNAPSGGVPDLRWYATLIATLDRVPPTVVAQVPPLGSSVEELIYAEVIFDEPVVGVDASDLLVNGVPAAQVEAIAPGHFRFDFPPPALGLVELTFVPEHGITDRLGLPNAFAGATWTVQVNPLVDRRKVIISELMAESYRSLKDEDGDYPDWIEVANTGSADVNLRGWALTDEAALPRKWVFGDVTLPAHGYLVVFASQKNKTNLIGRLRLHTNFRLSNEGEYLALVAPDGEVVSEFDPGFPSQTRDVSFGRVPGSPEVTGYFGVPTPGARNDTSGAGFAPQVGFSKNSSPFVNAFPLKLTAPGPGLLIRYTLDGRVPSASSALYVEPIAVTNTVEVRARAFAEGLLPGDVHSEAFIRLSRDPAQQALYTSTLPILVMSTLRTATLGATRNTAVQFSLHEPIEGRASLLNPPNFTTRGGAKIRGSSSASLPKVPYAIEWWDEFNEDVKFGPLGLPADSEWVLYAPNAFDPVMIHNPFIHQLARDLGQYSPRTRFVELYVQKTSGTLLTNQWMGIYVLEEKPAIGGNRLDIAKLQPEDTAAPELTGGYLMKFDRLDPGDSGIAFSGGVAAAVDPKEPELRSLQRAPQNAYIRGYLANFSKSLTAANWRDPVLGYLPYIDITNWVDYHIVEVVSGNVDSLVLSAYFYKEREGSLKWGPHWDFDRALGSTDGRDANPRMWSTGPFFAATWWSRVLRDPTAWQLWVDRYQEFRAGGMSRSNVNRMIDRFAGEVAPSQKREETKWRVRPRGGSYQAEVNLMKNWLSNRFDYIDRQLVSRPTLSSPGGPVVPGFSVTLTKPVGSTLYYTLDGSDPRRAFGTNEVSPNALVYAGPISINENTRIVARAHDVAKRQTGGPLTSTPWSSPVTATFTVTPPALALTELMFHPAESVTDDGEDEDEFEFVELRNVSDRVVALAGYRLGGGMNFTFTPTSSVTELTPGERLLLVANRIAFASRYPGVGRIAGEYSGRLGNGGARVVMTGPLLEPVFDFEFEDRWHLAADGSGFSLVRRDDGWNGSTDPSQPAAWRLSTRFGGSPGTEDPASELSESLRAALRISELFGGGGKRNFVELEAPAGADVGTLDLSGWWLTDDRSDWRKFRLPAGSILAPNGTTGAFLLLEQSEFDLPNGGGMKLDPLGGEVWLLSANADGELTGFITGGSYAPADPGISLAADPQFLVEQRFAAATVATPGLPNAPFQVGPVVFRTVQFQPVPLGNINNTRDEFIELENISGAPVPLFDPAQPTLTWRLRGGIDLDLPSGLSLAPGARMVLVGFDPLRDRVEQAAFRARYGLAAGTPLIGPWQGNLSNEGDLIRLERPPFGPGEPTAAVPYVDLDVVSYGVAAPWPEDVLGTGRALVRVNLAGLGSTATSWTLATPTPGYADADLDGLPDVWESVHGLDPHSSFGVNGSDGDADGDGFTNRMEFLNGTEPQDATSGLHPQVIFGGRGQLVVHVATPLGTVLKVQRMDVLPAGSWETLRALTTGPDDAAGFTLDETDAPVMRFYRIITE